MNPSTDSQTQTAGPGSAERDALRADLRRLVMETGLPPTELARRAGLSPSTLNRFLNDTSARHVLSTRTLSRLAQVTGRRLDPTPPRREVGEILAPPPPPGPSDVPVLGHARGGQDGMFFDNGLVDSYVPRLHTLSGVRSAYALYMNSDSQEPVLRHGDLLYVNPAIPPRHGDDVVIELRNGEAYIKRLLRRSAAQLTAQQYNPACELEFAAEDIANVHLVVAVIKVRT